MFFRFSTSVARFISPFCSSAQSAPRYIKRRFAQFTSDEAGSTMMAVMGIISLLVLMGTTYTHTTLNEYRNSIWQTHWTQALYIAEAGIAMAQDEFKTEAHDLDALLLGADGVGETADDGILSFGSNVYFGNGNYSVVVTDNDDGDGDVYTDTDNIIIATSTGEVVIPPKTTRAVEAYLQVTFGSGSGIPNGPAMRAVINSAGPVETKGSLVVDGRGHLMDQTLTPFDGVYGVSTVQLLNQVGGSHIGGTNGSDYAPSKPASPAIIDELADWSAEGGFPATPDAVMGLPEGWLKEVAQSSYNGDQYVTDPNNLTFPLSGVTYVELASGGIWQDIDFGDSSGVLVVHNATTDAIMKNLNSGKFTGIIIADDIIHIHHPVLGVIYSLTPNPSGGNCIGNGSGDVMYCRDAIAAAAQHTVSSAPALAWARTN